MTEIPKFLYEMSEQLWTQDNRATADPIYLVQEMVRTYGFTDDYSSDYTWIKDGEEITDRRKIRYLNKRAEDGKDTSKYEVIYYKDEFETVQSFLTEKAAFRYIECNGHNLNYPRVYADSLHRNREMIQLREWIMSLTETERRKTNG
jgi:hypothetical protein